MINKDRPMDRITEQQIPRQSQQNKQDTIKRKIAEMMAIHPSWTFQQAWNELQRMQPHLFDPDWATPETEPSPVTRWLSPPELKTPFTKPIVEMTRSELADAMTKIAKRSDLMERYGSQLVQASKQSKLDQRIRELKDQGLDVQTAQSYLKSTEPELFNRSDLEENDPVIKDKVKKLKDAVKAHREKFPEHTFAEAYDKVVKANPELESGLTRVLHDSGDEND
jgi:hypothetical protein